ncbi:ethanolamine utilization acetate kinase EutQ [Exilibacterium tricleocarpae]|uniref:Ethanolamine utilization acetate kinase EutQ n=1 Tax=Exilibacterium tricleocarpae TaxID=2591008 RepID=A0A545TV73_9GAMM|nr:ethanolamine utilization acetate kinase EutQ [Exilibacterium tricleocarpae]TQV81117.1 ethanolamine utilization acetate kinase EutQ [Exilibacterium tricleocarpae]
MKTLVTAEDIKKLHRDGDTVLNIVARRTIITPEARDLAAKLGVAITESPAESTTVETIKQTLKARLPAGKHDPALLEQLVRKALSEVKDGFDGPRCERQVAANGVVLVRGNSVRFGKFDGAPAQSIGLTDVISAADNSAVSAGFMQWENASFPWTLTYDEIDVVLEGELHIRCDGQTYIGKPGDVFYIPKGAAIEFSAPEQVRFVYVTYPADWSAAESA